MDKVSRDLPVPLFESCDWQGEGKAYGIASLDKAANSVEKAG